MARKIADGHVVNPVRNRLRYIWLQLKSKSKDFTCSSCGRDRNVEFETEAAELSLLICIMFPKYSTISIEDFVIYAMGLEIFEDVLNDMFEMRSIFREFINIMNRHRHAGKDELEEGYVEMDSDAHELAMWKASRFAFARGIIRNKWLKTNSYKHFRGLSLVLKRIREYPVKLKCPKLSLLQLKYRDDSYSLPVDFFEGMKELRVLSLDVPSMPQSLFSLLRNLQTLRLKLLRSDDISAIGGLSSLKFLSISALSLIDVPVEMGQLENLRLLDLRKMNINYIPPGVLSNMSKLEELYLPFSFRRWGCKVKEVNVNCDKPSVGGDDGDDETRINASLSESDNGERINACFSEIVSLSLSALQISVQKASCLPASSSVFNHVCRFEIFVQNNLTYQQFGRCIAINKLQLSGDACDIKESGICALMSRTEFLNLTRVRNLKSVMYQLEDDDFSLLKQMIVAECDELEYIVDTKEKKIAFSSFCVLERLHLSMLSNLKEIWHGVRPHFRWFENLRQINIRFCHKLKYVFPVSMARGLRQLQSIEILDCNEIEGIFCKNEEDNTYGIYYIEELYLHSLPKLVGFLVQKDNKIDEVGVDRSRNEEATTSLSLIIDEGSHVCKEHIINHMEMCCAISSKMMENRLESLQKLKIAFCDALHVIFSFNKDDTTTSRVLRSLKELELYGLQNLSHIWFQVPPEIMAFQNLQLLCLSKCHSLLYVLSPRVSKLLVRLQKLLISRCEKMEEIVVKEDDEEVEEITSEIAFPELKVLELQHMPSLKVFYGGISPIDMPLLESCMVNECDRMESFSHGSLNTPLLERVQINGSSYPSVGDLNATVKCHEGVTTYNQLGGCRGGCSKIFEDGAQYYETGAKQGGGTGFNWDFPMEAPPRHLP